MEGDVITMQDIFVFRRTGRSEDGTILGDFIPTGIRPRCAEQLIRAGVDLTGTSLVREGALS
jgi:pilus assembly protein CpaF